MSVNTEIAAIFDEMSKVLMLIGANPFKVNAHANVARILKDMVDDISQLVDEPAKITAIEGIGKGSAKKIIEYVQTGSIKEHQELLDSIPHGLLDVLAIQGLGPKTVKLMWEKAGVVDIKTLQNKIKTGEIEKLPRMGAKTIQNITESIEFAAKASQRIRLGDALITAEEIIDYLRTIKGVKQVEYAGSLRRGRDTIGDIDILACGTQPDVISQAFQKLPGVEKVLAAGKTKSSIRLASGIQVDLRVIENESFGAAYLYFTGSKQHNVLLREIAIQKNLRLNEYGLYPDDGEQDKPPQQRGIKPVAAKTEQDIYKALDLPWIAPEIREDRGEINLKKMPKLIELEDIKAELHAHTIASDGKMTIDELALQALDRGFHTIAVTDHSRSSVQANGLTPERLRKHIQAVHEANERTKGITILAGSEVDIHADGRLDYDDKLLAELDIVVASPHSALRQDSKAATKRLVSAISHPLVHILGHPTGRIINRREGLSPDINALIKTALKHDTALEINANYLRLDLRDIHIKAAVDAGALIAINTDAHSPDNFDLLRYGILTARRGWLIPKLCVNTWTNDKLYKWLQSKR